MIILVKSLPSFVQHQLPFSILGICSRHTRKSICDGRIFIERPARYKCLIEKYFAEDNICSLIINVKPELKPSKDSLPIAPMSSPAIANTHVVCRTSLIYSLFFLCQPFY